MEDAEKNGNESSSGELEEDYSRKVEEENEEVLDYDEDVDDEKQQIPIADTDARTLEPNIIDKANPIKIDPKKLGSDGELSSSDGEVASEDEGEIKDEADEYEEGEMREEMMPDRPRTCRFFEMGTCTWGERCRFLHPGINDKGNYDMFSDSYKRKQSRAEDFPKMDFPSAWDNPEPEPEPQVVETAWERGLRHAKELKRQALLRKVQEPDFVQKRDVISLNHALNEDRDLEFVDQKSLGPRRRGYDPFQEYEDDEYATPNPEDLRRNGRFDKLRLQSEASRYGSTMVAPPPMPMMHDKERMMHGMPRATDRRSADQLHGVIGEGDRDHRRYDRRRMDTDNRRMDRDDRKLNESAKNRIMDTDHRVKPGATPDKERGRSSNKHASGDQWQDPWARSAPNKSRKDSTSSDSSSSSGSSSRSSSRSSNSSRSSSRSSYSSRSSSSSGSDSSRSPSPVKTKAKKEPVKTTSKKPVPTKAKAAVKAVVKSSSDSKTTKTSTAAADTRGRPAVKKKPPPKKEKKRSRSSSSEFSHSDSSASPSRKSSGSDSDSGSSSGSSDSSFSSSSDSDSDDRSKRNSRKAPTKKKVPSKATTKPSKVAVPSKPGSRKDVKMTIINKPNQSKAPSKPESRKRGADGSEGKGGKKVNRRVELLQQLKAVEDAIAKKRAKLS